MLFCNTYLMQMYVWMGPCEHDVLWTIFCETSKLCLHFLYLISLQFDNGKIKAREWIGDRAEALVPPYIRGLVSLFLDGDRKVGKDPIAYTLFI